AEWEFAARGETGRRYPWGEDEVDAGDEVRANYGSGPGGRGDGFELAAPVGRFAAGASAFGVFDMAGNVSEWCSDWYDPDTYLTGPDRDPTGPPKGTMRVLRGGNWCSTPSQLRATRRDFSASFP